MAAWHSQRLHGQDAARRPRGCRLGKRGWLQSRQVPYLGHRQRQMQRAVRPRLVASSHGNGLTLDCRSEFVLKRDGENVEVSAACAIQSGTWKSPYDGVSVTSSRDLDIDHFVPLKNAWISGASSWTTEQRKGYANDITRPQLWAVSQHANRAKGDSSPDLWKPPLTSFYCTYAESWVEVKSFYKLTITDAEKNALSSMLDSC
ncbi:Uncharacterized protein TCAP_05107 [Tolypocladium capitatum]|uniref:GmrSD restriction endonucleases C-terminal domain-containing protein n=1 Tax=Tolypocladium capitatum TaxID=45235 RepID=A0A2K3QBN2_9HYPO|nr:Uncharacterized protein TCAP_05107 [Tolypocladium capitatum]